MSENMPVEIMESSAAIDVNLDTDVKLNLIDKFPSLAKDETARISLIAFDTAENKNSPLLKLSQSYYVEVGENKVSFAAPKNKEMLAKVISKYGEPKIRFATIVLRYHTDKNGTLIKNNEGLCDFNYYVWVIGPDKWQTLKSMHQEWNLFQRDMLIKWDGKSDIKYQNLTIQPAQDCYWKHHPQAQAIMEQGKALYNQSIFRFLAKEIPDEELVIKLGWESAPPAVNPGNPFNKSPQAQLEHQASAPKEGSNPFNKIVKPA